VAAYRELGTPVIFRKGSRGLEWWSQGVDSPVLKAEVDLSGLETFFERQRREFAPEAVYRAKTRGRLDPHYQLEFVDVGLMPLVEQEIGRKLAELVERTLLLLRDGSGWNSPTTLQGRTLIRNTFWLLAGKILHDKEVPGFQSLDLRDVDEVMRRVREHYGALPDESTRLSLDRRGLTHAADLVARFASLNHVTTEALAEVYESSLITPETRRFLGVHSTPPWLVDYILWRLEDWIEGLPLNRRRVLEPACGHGAFLVAALRLLREHLPKGYSAADRRAYLRRSLAGIEVDHFAIELARLSLTLADIPNPNGWRLSASNMFSDRVIERHAAGATILLANPPFEDFKPSERQILGTGTFNKAAEMLARALPALKPGSVFGVIVPGSFLDSKAAASVRSLLAKEYELQEITLLPDKVFRFSDMECAVLLGRRKSTRKTPTSGVRYRWVREAQIEDFKRSYGAEERIVAQNRLAEHPSKSFFLPQLEDVWEHLAPLPRFGSLADIAEGFSFKSERALPEGIVSQSQDPFPGAVKGFVRIGPELQLHDLPRELYVNVGQEALIRARKGTITGIPQILMNRPRVARGPWRVKGVIDQEGHACTDNFNVIRPRSPRVRLQYLWAIVNSPISNAFLFTHSFRRHNLPGVVAQLPVPRAPFDSPEASAVVEAARKYLAVVTSERAGLSVSPDEENARRALLELDAALLQMYSLPPRLERKLLDLFAGYQREGVPFPFLRYYPPDFRPCFPLHEFLSEEYRRSTVGELLKQPWDKAPESVKSALRNATEAFEA